MSRLPKSSRHRWHDSAVRPSAHTFSANGVGGVRIAADRYGDPGAPATAFLHRGGETRRSWGRVAAAVEPGWHWLTAGLGDEFQHRATALHRDERRIQVAGEQKRWRRSAEPEQSGDGKAGHNRCSKCRRVTLTECPKY